MASPATSLLRQPHSFERLLLVVVVPDFYDLPCPQRADHGIVAGKLDAAALALRNHQEQGDGPVLSHGPDLQVLHPPPLPGVVPDPEPFTNRVVSSVVLRVET